MEWQEFELLATKYLNENFGTYATFEHEGFSDSTTSDIKVLSKVSKQTYYIEVKMSPAQCGQFVLIPNNSTNKFEFSKKNKSRINEHIQTIIEYMNDNYNKFCEAGTAGQAITFENDLDVFQELIVNQYKNHNVKLFFTNNNIIVPINDFSRAFKISAKYRIKRSGSSDVGKKHMDEVISHISTNYTVASIKSEGNKLFFKSNAALDNIRFYVGTTQFMIAKKDDNYTIRKLSNTFNANVIFSIELNKNYKGLTNEEFINLL